MYEPSSLKTLRKLKQANKLLSNVDQDIDQLDQDAVSSDEDQDVDDAIDQKPKSMLDPHVKMISTMDDKAQDQDIRMNEYLS